MTGKETTRGSLWLVATPIGNLSDFSSRATSVLANVDIIASEDTRVTKKLLNHLDISKPLISYREENEKFKSLELADLIDSGQSVAIVSDAGYPGISDPGFRLVRECRRRGINVFPIPGPNAAITALAASGLPTHQFLFLGFLSKKASAIEKVFIKWADFEGSIIIYESKFRIKKTLLGIKNVLGGARWICVSREITKLNETFYIGTIEKINNEFGQLNPKGEFTMVIAPKDYIL